MNKIWNQKKKINKLKNDTTIKEVHFTQHMVASKTKLKPMVYLGAFYRMQGLLTLFPVQK
jgi:hypothetical protein